MEFRITPLHVFILLFVVVAAVGIHVEITSQEAYWKSAFPNTPIPKPLIELLHPDLSMKQGEWEIDLLKRSNIKYVYGHSLVGEGERETENLSVQQLVDQFKETPFFLHKDMHRGAYIDAHFTKSMSISNFLSRREANSIPFSSTRFPEIMSRLSIKPNSAEEETVKHMIRQCEVPASQGEKKHCATSLESMVDFVKSDLGENIQAISTETSKETTPFQRYIVTGAKKVAGDVSVICHKMNYPYAVYYCHKLIHTTPYKISLVGTSDGTKVDAVAICHDDTTTWDPKYEGFKILNVKPGKIPICHYLLKDTVVYVPYTLINPLVASAALIG